MNIQICIFLLLFFIFFCHWNYSINLPIFFIFSAIFTLHFSTQDIDLQLFSMVHCYPFKTSILKSTCGTFCSLAAKVIGFSSLSISLKGALHNIYHQICLKVKAKVITFYRVLFSGEKKHPLPLAIYLLFLSRLCLHLFPSLGSTILYWNCSN